MTIELIIYVLWTKFKPAGAEIKSQLLAFPTGFSAADRSAGLFPVFVFLSGSFSVVFIKHANDAARIASRKYTTGNIVNHNRTAADHTAFMNRDAAVDHTAAGDPDMIFNNDGQRFSRPVLRMSRSMG